MRLAVIPGDGIGPEVIAEALKVLHEVVPNVEETKYDLGAARWHSTGELLPESVLGELRQHDAILLGAVGDPSVSSGVCCCACGSSLTITSTYGRLGCTRGCRVRSPTPARST